MSMLGFVRALWSVFDRVMPWRRALVLGLTEQGANVLVPAGGAGGPAFGAFVLTKIWVSAELAARRHAALFLLTSAVTFVAIFLAGILTTVHVLPHDVGILATLLPAVGAAAVIALALRFAMSEPPHAPSGEGRDPPDPLSPAPVRPRRRQDQRGLPRPARPDADLRLRRLLRLRRRLTRLRLSGLRRRRSPSASSSSPTPSATRAPSSHPGRCRRHPGRPDRHVRRLRHPAQASPPPRSSPTASSNSASRRSPARSPSCASATPSPTHPRARSSKRASPRSRAKTSSRWCSDSTLNLSGDRPELLESAPKRSCGA